MPADSAMHPAVIQTIAETTPMTEWIAARCGAALAHSGFYKQRLARSCPGPIDVAPLPARQPAVQPYQPVAGRAFTVTTVGILNPNKCADTIIRALGASVRLRQTAEYRLAGAITDAERERLTDIAEQIGFSGLHILGAVDDATLFAEMERADVLCCLRRPVLEGASASAIEGMKTGRPVIVADAGFYAELPDDLVFKVEIDPAPLRALLEEPDSRPELRQQTGARARDWAVGHFTADAYAIVVERLIERFVRARPLHELSRRVGRELAGLGVAPTCPRVHEIAAEMSDLFARTIEPDTDGAQA
jgi:glycosyltransferase involved in cell wall biosynthesis